MHLATNLQQHGPWLRFFSGRTIFRMRYVLAIPALVLVASQAVVSLQGAQHMNLESSSFAQEQRIPQNYTCDGGDVSPELHWSNEPQETKSFALIADDPDAPAGTWVHWVIYNIPAKTSELPEGLPKNATTAVGVQGLNDFKKVGYGGPCPPPGKPHRYFFKLYALDSLLPLKIGARKEDIEAGMQGHMLGNAELMGTYQRRAR